MFVLFLHVKTNNKEEFDFTHGIFGETFLNSLIGHVLDYLDLIYPSEMNFDSLDTETQIGII